MEKEELACVVSNQLRFHPLSRKLEQVISEMHSNSKSSIIAWLEDIVRSLVSL